MNREKRVFFIQSLNAFIAGIIIISVPLLMQERNISIETIGIIFAILPFIFQISRIIFGFISDFLGRKPFFILNSILNILHLLIYYFSYSPLGFALGKITEGIKHASLWSVNRPYLLDRTKNKRKSLVYLRSSYTFFDAIGRLLAGFLIIWLLYKRLFILCILLSILILPNALKLDDKRKTKFKFREIFTSLLSKKNVKFLKAFLLLFLFGGLSRGLVKDYVFPLFLKGIGVSTELIGVFLGTQLLISGIFAYLLAERIKSKNIIIFGAVLFPVICFLLAFPNFTMTIILTLLFGIAWSTVIVGHEIIFS